jgi:uncharacterized membrane protein YedE/YeeE
MEVSMKRSGFWSPYAAGAGLGLTLLATFYIAGRGLGASGAMALVTAESAYSLFPETIRRLKYFSQYVDVIAPLINWNLFLLIGLVLGSLTSALVTGNFKFTFDKGGGMSVRTRLITAFSGGMLIGFASRLARGCTSGVALTGGAQLAVAGWIFVIAMFATGFLTVALFRRLWS